MELVSDKKKAIFENTLDLIRDNGLHGTTMSLLIKKSGVAAGTIYHYFDSKDTLMMELHGYIREIMASAILEGDDESKDFKERFASFWTRQWQFYTEHPNALYFIEQYVNSPYYLRDPLIDNDRCQHIMTKFVKTGIDAGLLRDMDYRLMGIMVHSSVLTAAKIKLKKKIPFESKEINQLIEMVWDGIVRT